MSKCTGPAPHSEREDGFTLVELLVVIAIIALLMAILLPALTRARELGKRAVCLSQIKQLGAAWFMYCDNNAEKVPVSEVWYSWDFPSTYHGGPQPAWREWAHPFPHTMPPNPTTNHANAYSPGTAGPVPTGPGARDIWQHAISEGTLWRYVKDYKVYKCPVADKGVEETYNMSQSLFEYPNSGGTTNHPSPITYLRSEIKRTAERFVFIDEGAPGVGAYYIPYSLSPSGGDSTILYWPIMPPMRHGNGTTFVFVDQHAEYHKWTDPHTLAAKNYGWQAQPGDNSDCDLRWLTHATWGTVFLTNSSTSKKCEW